MFKLWIKWPDGTLDIVNHSAIPESVNYTHGHTQLDGLLQLQTEDGGYLWTEWTSTYFIFIPNFDNVTFFHKQGATSGLIKPVSKCQNFGLLVLLVVLGASSLCHEAFGQLLQVPGVFHLDLWLLSEEILKVLQQLDPHVCLLVQTFLLLHQLGPDLWKKTRTQTDYSDATPFRHMHWMLKTTRSVFIKLKISPGERHKWSV